MGKAGKWIINFLMGKKEEKFKKINAICAENKNGAGTDSPKVKRRRSFGRQSGGRTSKVDHKFSISCDSGDTAKLEIQTLQQNQAPRNIPTAQAKVFVLGTNLRSLAAIKIQAAFRSYLARKALHALRGLVKIQALVRGHLVRKQTTATLRSMHALMAIQVRARIQRIQMVEETNLLAKRPVQQTTEIPHSKGLIRKDKDSKEMSVKEMLEILKSRRHSLDRSHVKNMKHDSMTFYSKRKSISERHEYNENNLITAPNSPENYWPLSECNPATMASSTSQQHSVWHAQSWSPSYMNNTESSKAKARSQSEPKQRPNRGMKQKSRSAESPKQLVTKVKGPKQNMFTNSSRFYHGSLDHWTANLYGSTKDGSRRNSFESSRRDSFESSTMTIDSYY